MSCPGLTDRQTDTSCRAIRSAVSRRRAPWSAPGGPNAGAGRVRAQETGQHDSQWHQLYYSARRADGRLLGSFDFCCRVLVPLYAARALEEALYGEAGLTLSTSSEARRPRSLSTAWKQSKSLHHRGML